MEPIVRYHTSREVNLDNKKDIDKIYIKVSKNKHGVEHIDVYTTKYPTLRKIQHLFKNMGSPITGKKWKQGEKAITVLTAKEGSKEKIGQNIKSKVSEKTAAKAEKAAKKLSGKVESDKRKEFAKSGRRDGIEDVGESAKRRGFAASGHKKAGEERPDMQKKHVRDRSESLGATGSKREGSDRMERRKSVGSEPTGHDLPRSRVMGANKKFNKPEGSDITGSRVFKREGQQPAEHEDIPEDMGGNWKFNKPGSATTGNRVFKREGQQPAEHEDIPEVMGANKKFNKPEGSAITGSRMFKREETSKELAGRIEQARKMDSDIDNDEFAKMALDRVKMGRDVANTEMEIYGFNPNDTLDLGHLDDIYTAQAKLGEHIENCVGLEKSKIDFTKPSGRDIAMRVLEQVLITKSDEDMSGYINNFIMQLGLEGSHDFIKTMLEERGYKQVDVERRVGSETFITQQYTKI